MFFRDMGVVEVRRTRWTKKESEILRIGVDDC